MVPWFVLDHVPRVLLLVHIQWMAPARAHDQVVPGDLVTLCTSMSLQGAC